MRFFCYVILSLCCLNAVCAQDSSRQHLQQLPGKYFAQINSKYRHFAREGNLYSGSNTKSAQAAQQEMIAALKTEMAQLTAAIQ